MSKKRKHFYRISHQPLKEQYEAASGEPKIDNPKIRFLKEIAAILNVHPNAVRNWVTGKSTPSPIYKRMLAIYFRTPECILFKGMKPPSK